MRSNSNKGDKCLTKNILKMSIGTKLFSSRRRHRESICPAHHKDTLGTPLKGCAFAAAIKVGVLAKTSKKYRLPDIPKVSKRNTR
jgi:hypothetical protein